MSAPTSPAFRANSIVYNIEINQDGEGNARYTSSLKAGKLFPSRLLGQSSLKLRFSGHADTSSDEIEVVTLTFDVDQCSLTNMQYSRLEGEHGKGLLRFRTRLAPWVSITREFKNDYTLFTVPANTNSAEIVRLMTQHEPGLPKTRCITLLCKDHNQMTLSHWNEFIGSCLTLRSRLDRYGYLPPVPTTLPGTTTPPPRSQAIEFRRVGRFSDISTYSLLLYHATVREHLNVGNAPTDECYAEVFTDRRPRRLQSSGRITKDTVWMIRVFLPGPDETKVDESSATRHGRGRHPAVGESYKLARLDHVLGPELDAIVTNAAPQQGDVTMKIISDSDLPPWNNIPSNNQLRIRITNTTSNASVNRELRAISDTYYCGGMTTELGTFPLAVVLTMNSFLPTAKLLWPDCFDEPFFHAEFTDGMDQYQEQAFDAVVFGEHPVSIVIGPPGTGKTHIIATAVLALAIYRRDVCLLTAPSNAAVDKLTERVVELLLSREPEKFAYGDIARGQVVRWLPERMNLDILDALFQQYTLSVMEEPVPFQFRKIPAMVVAQSVAFLTFLRMRSCYQTRSDSNGSFAHGTKMWVSNCGKQSKSTESRNISLALMDIVLEEAMIILSTCNNCSTMHKNVKPTLLILDEASQAKDADLLIPLLAKRLSVQKLVLAGDINQLPPYVYSHHTDENEFRDQLGYSILERALCAQKEAPNFNVFGAAYLRQQRRMDVAISRIIREHFYTEDNAIYDAPERHTPRLVHTEFLRIAKARGWHHSPSNVMMVDLPKKKDFDSKMDSSRSWYNFAHISVVERLIDGLLTHEGSKITGDMIGVICPYAAQRSYLSMVIQQIDPTILVGTVDKLQGEERDILILDLVLRGHSTVGFMKEKRRLNVSLSRAKDVLLVVGDARAFDKGVKKADKMTGDGKKAVIPKEILEFYRVMVDVAATRFELAPEEDTITALNNGTYSRFQYSGGRMGIGFWNKDF
jgi:hypothetical protein